MTSRQVNEVPGIIAVDLDGTVLAADHKTVTPRTFQALYQCVTEGSNIVPATGRCEAIIPLEVFPPVQYVISCNGALITDRNSEQPLRVRHLPKEDVRAAWELVRERVRRYNLVMELFEEKQIVVERRIFEHPELYERRIPAFHRPVIMGGKAKYVESFDSYLRDEGDRVVKINFPGENVAECPEIREELIAMGRFETTSDGLNLEVTAKGCNKGEALLWLSDYLGVDRRNTVAFGDGNNDMSMLRAAGYGVAMGNAAPTVKETAGYCTASNVEDGVAVFLERTFPIGG